MENNLGRDRQVRLDAIGQEIRDIDPDILCLIEAPKGEADIDRFVANTLGGAYTAIKATDGKYDTKGSQWIWFLVRNNISGNASLLPTATWDSFTESHWHVNYWCDFSSSRHEHYRHPQVLILDLNGQRVEFIGLHLKSKFVRGAESDWKAGGKRKNDFIKNAIKARIKMTTEATNVRKYINAKFDQVERPAIFVMGDLNDGPGKEYFEKNFLFFDLISNVQGDIFSANKFLNHALFDYPENLRWSVEFDDFTDSERDPHILLDHVLFTQGLTDGSLPLLVQPRAGFVEHEIHDLINAGLTSRQETSDHRPVSVNITVED
jgi:endonuclease/exonuclease/phosphatase family metal-dependent hydrolase